MPDKKDENAAGDEPETLDGETLKGVQGGARHRVRAWPGTVTAGVSNDTVFAGASDDETNWFSGTPQFPKIKK